MKLLVISKHLLDLSDAQSQQSFAFIQAMQNIFKQIDIITATTNPNDLSYMKNNLNKNVNIFIKDAFFIKTGHGVITKIKRKLQRNLMAICETKWVKDSIEIANDLDRKYDYVAIITIGLPIESHMVGLGLINKTKWISSFSDPWPESIMPKPYSDYNFPIFSYLQKMVVKKTLMGSKSIIFTCAQSRNLFLKNYKFDVNKSFIIQHIAPDLINSIKNDNENFTITHAGSLSRERFFPELFHAINVLPKESKVKLEFIGHVSEDAKILIEKLNIKNRVKLYGQLDKVRTLELMKSSDALLLIEAKMDIYPFLPSKIADYSAFNLPVLAITGKDSSVAEIIQKTNSGYLTSHNIDEILKALLDVEKGTLSKSKKNYLYEYFRKENAQDKLKCIIKSLKISDKSHH